MLEILEHFESAMSGAERLSPAVLIGPGAAAVAAGLFVWLAGLSFKKVLAAISGAIGGGILASAAIGWTALPAAGSAAAATVVAAVFEKVFIIALAAGLATTVGIAFFMGPYIEIASSAEVASQGVGPTQAMTLSTGQSMKKLQAWTTDAGGQIRRACSEMQAHKWAFSAALGLIVVAGGSFLWRPTAALYFSAAGTMLVFAGMILLLLNKGVMPVSRICRRPSAYAGVFAAMVVFGTAEQLLLCRGAKTQPAEKETGKNKDRLKRK
ncbi:MAG: hypothetical protein ACYS0H_11970 [Planctomycetota bacterium]|jgi:hypothetical protein